MVWPALEHSVRLIWTKSSMNLGSVRCEATELGDEWQVGWLFMHTTVVPLVVYSFMCMVFSLDQVDYVET